MKNLLILIFSVFAINVMAQDKCEKNLFYQKDKMTEMVSYRTPMTFPVWAVKDFGADKKTSITILYLKADSYKVPSAGKENVIILLENGDKIETSGNIFGDVKEYGNRHGADYFITSSFVITNELWNKLAKSPIVSYRIGSGEGTLNKGIAKKFFERLSCLRDIQYK